MALLIAKDTAQIELSLLGNLILDPTLLKQVDVEADDFQYDGTARLYRCIKDLNASGMSIDKNTVRQKYIDDEGTDAINTALKFAIVPTLSAVQTYGRLVKEAAIKRRLYANAMTLINEIAEDAEISELLTAAKGCVNIVSHTEGRNIARYGDEYNRFITRVQSPIEYYPTGWSRLDNNLNISKGDYIVIGGRPSSGKTAFSLQMAVQMAQKYRVAYFSCETSIEKLTDRAVTTQAQINFTKVKHHSLEEWERNTVRDKRADAQSTKLWFINAAGKTVEWITQTALQLDAQIIFVDYIGLIKTNGNSPYERTTLTSMGLHIAAQQNGLTIVALSQLSRNANGKRPTITDLRESGQIEQDADAILLLQKGAEQMKNSGSGTGIYKHFVYLEKNKEGSTGTFDFDFIGYQQRFEEKGLSDHEE